MDRRRFLQTTGGMALMLGVVNLAACSGSESPAPADPTQPPGSAPGGTFVVPDTIDEVECAVALSGTELIIDVHTHHVMPDGPWRQNVPSIEAMIENLVPASCTDADPLVCLDRQAYVRDLFLGSDTTVALLSDVPSSGQAYDSPIPFEDQVGTHDFVASLSGEGEPRLFVQSLIAPNFFAPAEQLERMERQAASGTVASFKAYTAWGPDGQGYRLDDPVLGLPVIEKAQELGVRVIAAHKGLPIQGFDQRFNDPDDVVAAAALFPDMQFVVYHSGFERETTEGPYDPARAQRGTNALLRAMDTHAMPPSSNVWCELGTTWRECMSNPTEAAHVLGKLLTRMGPDRVLWGTDGIWLGSPQPQIMAFRTFEISAEFQERFGYPALTPQIKAAIFGLNATELLGLDPEAVRCGLATTGLTQARLAHLDMHASGEIAEPWSARAPITRRQVLGWLGSKGASLNPF
jgi:predicted TIM-barrel fold metal-dependent hydrolase